MRSSPFRCRLLLYFQHCRRRLLDASLAQKDGDIEIEEMVPPPLELDLERLPVIAVTFTRNGNIPELLGHKRLHTVVLVDDETKRGELARAIADELLIAEFWNADLQGLRQKACERSTDAEVQLGARFDSLRLILVKVAGLSTSLMDLTEG